MPSIVIYARVSTDGGGQSTEMQLHTCREHATVHGYTIKATYEDHASAVDLRGRRRWRAMMDDLARWAPRQRPHYVLAYALDRVARSLIDYVTITQQLKALGVAIVTVDGTLGALGEDGNPYREAMAGMAAVFAELERKVIVARVRSGVANARAKGKRLGRPAREIDWQAYDALPEGLSWAQRAGALGVPITTLRSAVLRRAEIGVVDDADGSIR